MVCHPANNPVISRGLARVREFLPVEKEVDQLLLFSGTCLAIHQLPKREAQSVVLQVEGKGRGKIVNDEQAEDFGSVCVDTINPVPVIT